MTSTGCPTRQRQQVTVGMAEIIHGDLARSSFKSENKDIWYKRENIRKRNSPV